MSQWTFCPGTKCLSGVLLLAPPSQPYILRPDIDILRLDINIVSLDIQSDGCISHLLSNLADLQNDARQLSSS